MKVSNKSRRPGPTSRGHLTLHIKGLLGRFIKDLTFSGKELQNRPVEGVLPLTVTIQPLEGLAVIYG